MSTRSKTRAAAAANASATSSIPEKPISLRKNSIISQQIVQPDISEKENLKGKPVQVAAKKGKRKVAKKAEKKPLYCICTRGDDGSPMVYCAECKVWYHFTCVDLSEPEAEEINVYICPSCTEKSGRHTAMDWEGEEALEECTPPPAKLKPLPRLTSPKEESDDSADDPSSEDEYISEQKHKGKSSAKHRSLPSESDSDDSDDPGSVRRAVSKQRTPDVSILNRKRRNTNLSGPPPPKRKKSHSVSAAEDPTRKYCLGKLEDLFKDVFLRYPHVRIEHDDQGPLSNILPKPLEELTEEEKDALVEESKQFAKELEQCVYDIYSEPDKLGAAHAGGKYKDRFRMLQFNLSKVDRVMIHQRITSASITAKEISLMSSTDLADEETKQSIKIAEQEALEHSILQKPTAPRAKITHKGLQDIEDVNGEVSSARDIELQRERELESEQRRERERTARLRAVPRQRTASMSVPPESPTVAQHSPTAESWGAPPPIPLHVASSSLDGLPSLRSPVSQLFPPSVSELSVSEPELNLADLINIDDEPSGQDAPSASATDQPGSVETRDYSSAEPVAASPVVQSPTGISPFAAMSQRQHSMSFDLNALWNGPKEETSPSPVSPSVPEPPPAALTDTTNEPKDVIMDTEPVEEANDQDFDMFLDEKEQEPAPEVSVEDVQAVFDSVPEVWNGKIAMPLDSTMPQETPVVGRQMGGRPLESNSPLWKTLFPSDMLRIDGRVPIENSSKFLLQMRMTAAKELIGVAFSPTDEVSRIAFKTLSDFLIGKNRHGLVFPWGTRPKEYHPGRELYIIPLLSSQPLPEYMELLDDLKLPSQRRVDYLIGIWVLNKGKLAPLPTPPPPTSAPPPIPNAPIPPQNSIPNIPALQAHMPTELPHAPPNAIVNPPPSTLPNAPISSSALAAEVASLTPEQIQNVLRSLSANFIPNPQQANPTPIPPLLQQALPNQPQTQQQLSWPPAPPSGYYPPQPNNTPQPPLPHLNSPPSHTPYERRTFPRDPRSTSNYDRGGQGDRGWRGGRGRGRGRGRDDGTGPQRSPDSGWPRRRNDSREGGPSSPIRRW